MSYDFNDVSDNKLSDEVCQSYRYEVQMLDKGTGEWGCLCTFDSLDDACAHLELVSKHVHSYDVPGWRVRKFCEPDAKLDAPATVLNRDGYIWFEGTVRECISYCEKYLRYFEIWLNEWFDLNVLA